MHKKKKNQVIDLICSPQSCNEDVQLNPDYTQFTCPACETAFNLSDASRTNEDVGPSADLNSSKMQTNEDSKTPIVVDPKYALVSTSEQCKMGLAAGIEKQIVPADDEEDSKSDYVAILHAQAVNSTIEYGIDVENVSRRDAKGILTAQWGKDHKKRKSQSFTQVNTYIANADAVNAKNIDWYVSVQRILIEWDRTTKNDQIRKIKKIAKRINTPMFFVFSGNKSLHLSIYFNHFASNAKEYEEQCFAFYAWLCSEFPDEFWYTTSSTDIPKDKLHLVPDFSMWKGGYRWTRRANGKNRETGAIQKAEILHGSSTDILDINEFLIPEVTKL